VIAMPNYTSWLGNGSRVRDWRAEESPRTAGVEAMINDKPAEIIIFRDGVALDEQTVRIDVFGSSVAERLSMGSNAYTNAQRVLVLGYRNHPNIDDTDIQTQDEFAFDGQFYRVVKVESAFTDRVEAVAEATE
jgi:hypothetical protein